MRNAKIFPAFLMLLLISGITKSYAQQPPGDAWMEAYAQHPEQLQEQYFPAAIRMFLNGTYVQGAYTLGVIWQQSDWKLQERTVLHQAQPHVQDYLYEIAEYSSSSGTQIAELCIWNLKEDKPLKEFEFIVPISGTLPKAEVLDPYREKWMELCNAHKVSELINTLYAPQTLYYNHRPMVKGRKALIPVYGYMESPDYSLQLTPLAVVPVRSDLILELGQCSGSYPGKYMLVWQRNEKGTWEIILDSNI